ncbi:hypothetical protein BXZ70DRAFT_340204 [Cristinia sonorae]|uniref:Uncharacterized protein n=1 Tax=Cristinia sonorae TaxID=1940300 RepID=A0A8K0UM36_9AGAR|nr:hypothetical protein BXZ70DRAFT_340204 [Cristinia sonorae]
MNLHTIINAGDVGGLGREHTGNGSGELSSSSAAQFRSARMLDPLLAHPPSQSLRVPVNEPPTELHTSSTNLKWDVQVQAKQQSASEKRPTKRRKVIVSTTTTNGSRDVKSIPKTKVKHASIAVAEKTRTSSPSELDVPAFVAGKRRRLRHQPEDDANPRSGGHGKGKGKSAKLTLPKRATPASNRSSISSPSVTTVSSEAQEVLRLARETVEAETEGTIMDVILDAQPQVKQYSEDLLMDAVEARQRIQRHNTPRVQIDDADAPGRITVIDTQRDLDAYWEDQAVLWRGHDSEDQDVDVPPKRFYRLSAERSTANWIGELDSVATPDDRGTSKGSNIVHCSQQRRVTVTG